MSKLIGNYTLPEQTEEKPASDAGARGTRCSAECNGSIVPSPAPDDAASEFERRAMARLGGSIAFVMKGKNVVWTGGAKS